MRTVKFPVVSIILFVFAVLFAAYTIWAASYAFNTISEAVAAGQLVISGSEFEVANFLMNNVAQYVFFAIVLFALGRIVQVVSPEADDEAYADEDEEEDTDEDSSFEEVSDENTAEAACEASEQNSAA
ncbi:MAG: hypothetical protein WHX52_11170 [Anaerolineae bacterium]